MTAPSDDAINSSNTNNRDPNATDMTDHELDELLGAYALDAVSDAERGEIEAYLDRSAAARAELRDHYEVVAALATTPGDAPTAIWARLEAQLVPRSPSGADRSTIAAMPPPADAAPTRAGDVVALRTRSPWRRRVGAAAAAAAVAASLGAQQIRIAALHDQVGDARVAAARDARRAAQLRVELDRAVSSDLRVEQLLARSGSSVATLVAADGAPLAKVVVGSDGQGYLVGRTLPTLGSGRTYQLWGVAAGKVLSLGVLGEHPSVVAFAAHERWQKFVLTEESAPGVASSTQPAYAAGDVTVI